MNQFRVQQIGVLVHLARLTYPDGCAADSSDLGFQRCERASDGLAVDYVVS